MNDPTIQLCLVLHNHQPVGNFDEVFERAYQDSYLPFLNAFESFENLKITLHTSGPLAKWLDENHGEYLDRLADLVEADRIEVIGGPMHEPILTMLPARDRIGQIKLYTEWLSERLQAQIDGLWMPERVWEASLTKDLCSAGIRYTVLDDFHFVNAGIAREDLSGYFITEDEGAVLRVFPGSEKLRYLIPFAEPEATLEYLRERSQQHPGAVYTFGDDGEKFGTWPETKKHVYEDGWLKKFFGLLEENRSWLKTCTLQEAVMTTAPMGKVYIPNCSYREMTEWSFPVQRQKDFDSLQSQRKEQEDWPEVRSFMGGGFWRNFKIKYNEATEMYARMMFVSGWLNQAVQEGRGCDSIDLARDHLYQAQCNCAYWHGAFGGIYLPHLRNAVYENLIQSEKWIDKAYNRDAQWVDAAAEDFNFDGHPEIRLANDQLVCWMSPLCGGMMYELDLKSICQNLLASMQRRFELYHEKVAKGQTESSDETTSIHDRVVFKQENLEQHLIYDERPRKSLIDHFWDEDVSLGELVSGAAQERGDFADGAYQAKIRRKENRIQIQMTREGNAWGVPLKITKGVTLSSGSNELEIAYLIEGIPEDRVFNFGVEYNFAAMPAEQGDRFFKDANGTNLGHLGSQLHLENVNELSLVDEWLRLNATLGWDQAGGVWTFPIATVSQSEGGFELVHQSTVVQPHWLVSGDAEGRWATRMQLKLTPLEWPTSKKTLAKERSELILDH